MKSLKGIISSIFLLMAAMPLKAVDFNDIDKANIERIIMGYVDAVNRNHYDVVVARIPREVRDVIAEYSLMDKAAIVGVLARELEFQNSMLKIKDMRPIFKEIRYGDYSDEMPYFIVPVSYQFIDSNGTPIKAETELFGILKENAWYMVRPEDDFVLQIWRQKFPNMRNIELKETRFTVISSSFVDD